MWLKDVEEIKALQDELETLQEEQIRLIQEGRHTEEGLKGQIDVVRREKLDLQTSLDRTIEQLGAARDELAHQKEVQST